MKTSFINNILNSQPILIKFALNSRFFRHIYFLSCVFAGGLKIYGKRYDVHLARKGISNQFLCHMINRILHSCSYIIEFINSLRESDKPRILCLFPYSFNKVK